MNFLFILEYYKPHVWGAEILFENLISGLAEQWHTITIVTTKYQAGLAIHEKIGEHVQIYRVGSNRYNFMRHGLQKAWKLIYKHKFDIIQTTTFNAAVPAGLLRLFHRIPTILHVHEIYGNLRYKFMWWKGWFYKMFEHFIFCFRFDHYTCSSLYTKNQLRIYFGLDDSKLTTTYCGIDYELWDPEKIKMNDILNLRAELGLENRYVWLYFGRAGVAKGLPDFLRAIPQIIEHIPKFAWLLIVPKDDTSKTGVIKNIVGNDEVEQMIQELWIQDHIVWLPSVPYKELRNYVMMSDVVVLPTYAEGFGLAIAETCALGKNLITTNVGSVPEVVSGRVNLVNPWNSEDIARKMVDFYDGNCEQIPLKPYLWKDCVQRFLDAYRKLKKH